MKFPFFFNSGCRKNRRNTFAGLNISEIKDSSTHNFFLKAFKFGIVGALSTIVNYGTFAFLYKIVRLFYLLSSITGYITGLLFGYFLNKNWTFVAQVDKERSYLLGYSTVYVISLISSQLLLILLVEKIRLDPLLANIFAITLSTTMNFLGTNFLVFRKKHKEQ